LDHIWILLVSYSEEGLALRRADSHTAKKQALNHTQPAQPQTPTHNHFHNSIPPTTQNHTTHTQKTKAILSQNHHTCNNTKPEGEPLGKKKVLSEEEIHKLVIPAQGDVLGIATKLLGYDRILVKCQDGNERLCRIRGKMKRRVWIRQGDIVLVSPWDFQSDKRGDVFWRYTKAQAETLRKRGYLTI